MNISIMESYSTSNHVRALLLPVGGRWRSINVFWRTASVGPYSGKRQAKSRGSTCALAGKEQGYCGPETK